MTDTCTTTGKCIPEYGLTCSDGQCTAIPCTLNSQCPDGFHCVNGYCTAGSKYSTWQLLAVVILLLVIVAVCGGGAYYLHKKKKMKNST